MKWGSARTSLLLIVALFAVPLIVAWMMYTGVIRFEPVTLRHHGELIEPPVPVDPIWLSRGEGREWILLHMVEEPCRASCLQAVTNLRQLRRALGRNQSRLNISLAFEHSASAESSKEIRLISEEFTVLGQRAAPLQQALGFEAADGETFLVDPLGNIMMRYAQGTSVSEIKKDLDRLMKWSKMDQGQ